MTIYLKMLIYILSFLSLSLFLALIIFHLRLKYYENKEQLYKEKYSSIIESYIDSEINLEKTISYFENENNYKILKNIFKPYINKYENEKHDRLKILINKIGLNNYLYEKLKSNNKKKTLKAASFLGKLQDRNALNKLEKLLRSNDRLKVITSAWAISEIGDLSYLKPVIKTLLNKSEMTYEAITELLVNFGKNICDKLIDYLNKDLKEDDYLVNEFETDEYKILSVFIDIFGFYRYEKSLKVLEKLLIENTNEEVTIHIFKALVKIGQPVNVNLKQFLQSESWVIRSQSAKYIGVIGAEEHTQTLSYLLYDENWWVGYYAAQSLWKMDKTELMKNIIKHDNPGAEMCSYVLAKNNYVFNLEGS